MNECKGIAGWLFGHDFLPVFERLPVPVTSFKQGGSSASEMVQMFDAIAGNKHVHTICTRCGATAGQQDGGKT